MFLTFPNIHRFQKIAAFVLNIGAWATPRKVMGSAGIHIQLVGYSVVPTTAVYVSGILIKRASM
jgi:hypothetical protein